MDHDELVDHLNEDHGFSLSYRPATHDFVVGVHHGVHVGEGTEVSHLHAVEGQQIPPGGGTVQWQE